MHTLLALFPLLTVHWAPLWLRGGRCRAATGHSEVGGQGVRRPQGRPPHVFGPELLSPWGSSAKVLIVILEERWRRKRKVERSRQVCKRKEVGFTYNVSRSLCYCIMCVYVCHLFHSPVCANGQQTVVFTLKSCSGLEKRGKAQTVTEFKAPL